MDLFAVMASSKRVKSVIVDMGLIAKNRVALTRVKIRTSANLNPENSVVLVKDRAVITRVVFLQTELYACRAMSA